MKEIHIGYFEVRAARSLADEGMRIIIIRGSALFETSHSGEKSRSKIRKKFFKEFKTSKSEKKIEEYATGQQPRKVSLVSQNQPQKVSLVSKNVWRMKLNQL
jgi:hypothetical protein